MSDNCTRWSTDAQRTAWKAEAEAEIAPLADEKVAQYRAHQAELTDDEIALMEAMCAETAPAGPPEYSGMWK